MKLRISIVAVLAVLMAMGCSKHMNTGNQALETDIDSVSYSIGLSVGRSLKQDGMDDIKPGLIAQAMRDVMEEKEYAIAEEDVKMIINSYMQAKQKMAGQENKKEGEAFLTENKTKEGIEETASGLQYKVLEEGKGATPNDTSTVRVHYEGRLIDGTVFDSSYERGEPAQFAVNRVIPGWTEALQLMKPGGKWEVYIPSDLAYGPRGAGQDIGPNETLVFTVELIEVAPEE